MSVSTEVDCFLIQRASFVASSLLLSGASVSLPSMHSQAECVQI